MIFLQQKHRQILADMVYSHWPMSSVVVVVFQKLPQKRQKNDNLLKIVFHQISRKFSV